MDKSKVLKIAMLSTTLTLGIIAANSKFHVAQASLDAGRPMLSNGDKTCCQNAGNDCGAACCN